MLMIDVAEDVSVNVGIVMPNSSSNIINFRSMYLIPQGWIWNEISEPHKTEFAPDLRVKRLQHQQERNTPNYYRAAAEGSARPAGVHPPDGTAGQARP
jgi:hypothetical protein